MGEWKKSSCVLCAQNCGLEVFVENNKMVKIRPDKDNPRSKGYVCRKGLNVIYHQYPKDRITSPLKRVGNDFVEISWDNALEEIAHKLQSIIEKYGPKSFAYVGASAQGGHFEGMFGVTLLRLLGSQYLYTSAGQEFSGAWWVCGRLFGRQYLITIPDETRTEMLIAWGWNGMQSHQMPRARKVLLEISKDPNRLLVSIDPRKSDTARISNIHLQIRPGCDALLAKAMISIIIQNKWENREYIEKYVEGFEKIRPFFESFNWKLALDVCRLKEKDVIELCKLMVTKKWAVHPDLGVYMGRHSALTCYLINVLGAICGIIGMPGGNIIPGMFRPLGYHADERDPKTWRTVCTNMPPAAAGSYPCSVLPKEILCDHPEKIRAILLTACNPVRSWPDSHLYEEAFSKLDLLVVNEIVLSETARFAHYVLPCRTFYESYDGTFFPWTYPKIYFQMRQPVVPPPKNCLEASQIITNLAKKLGFVPEIPKDLIELSKEVNTKEKRLAFGAKLMEWVGKNPSYLKTIPFILAETMGKTFDSANLAALWGILITSPKSFRENAKRVGFQDSPFMGDDIFEALLNNPQGLWIGEVDLENNLSILKTPSKKIELYVLELKDMLKNLTPENEENELTLPKDFPFILNAGRHFDKNANTLMRDPEWNKGKRTCTAAINREDAKSLGIQDGQMVKVVTKTGYGILEAEVTDDVAPSMVLIPHGFGLIYNGKEIGFNVNYLTSSDNIDFLGTPIHRFVPCRIEPVE